jgi:hypothetical protein
MQRKSHNMIFFAILCKRSQAIPHVSVCLLRQHGENARKVRLRGMDIFIFIWHRCASEAFEWGAKEKHLSGAVDGDIHCL